MPYLKEGRKKEVGSEPKRANTDGDYNFLYTREYLRAFIANPCYATVALIRKASLDPHRILKVEELEDFLTFNGVPFVDRAVARDLAYLEFYRRIGSTYEDFAMSANGDVAEYQEAMRSISAKFAAEAK